MRLAAGLILLCAAPAWAGCPGLAVSDPWIEEAPPVSMALAGYATLENKGDKALRIDSASGADFAFVEIHDMSMSGGMMRMRELDHLDIPAHGQLKLASGGIHLMLLNPKHPLKSGDSSSLSLRCGSNSQDAVFPVKAGQ
jgi:periplasmic copper chaperone A